jgi:hydroxylaminobenzene mutase
LAGPKLKNPRMGLASHLEGVMNGMFLVILGLVWPRLGLSHAWLVVTFWLIVYAAYANWVATLLAAAWGAGAQMPIAAGTHKAAPRRERVIGFLLVSLALCVVAA